MGFNATAMVRAANALIAAYPYGQIHAAAAGVAGTSNVSTAARQALGWAAPTGLGSFALTAPVNFSGGAANGAIYSLTVWSLASGGEFGGEFLLSGDMSFNSVGAVSLTALNETGSAS